MKPWKVLRREVILDHSKYLKVENHSIELPDTSTINDWPWVISPDYSIVIPRAAGGSFICFQQTKYAVDGITLAPVGGYLETGEQPIHAAQRELLEETGYRADRWEHLGSYVTDGNHFCGTAHLFFAENAVKVQEPDRDDLEEMVIKYLSYKELKESLLKGEFKVIAWTAAIAMALISREDGERSS